MRTPYDGWSESLNGQAVFDYSNITALCPPEYSWPYRNYIRIDPPPTTWFYAMLADSRVTHRFLTRIVQTIAYRAVCTSNTRLDKSTVFTSKLETVEAKDLRRADQYKRNL